MLSWLVYFMCESVQDIATSGAMQVKTEAASGNEIP
jgi:hypothetical protein